LPFYFAVLPPTNLQLSPLVIRLFRRPLPGMFLFCFSATTASMWIEECSCIFSSPATGFFGGSFFFHRPPLPDTSFFRSVISDYSVIHVFSHHSEIVRSPAPLPPICASVFSFSCQNETFSTTFFRRRFNGSVAVP